MDSSPHVSTRAIAGLLLAISLGLGFVATGTSAQAQIVSAGQSVTSGGVTSGSPSRAGHYDQLRRDLILWCRSDLMVMSTYGGSVGAWLDSSRRRAHLGQENLTKAPRLELLGAAGHPELVFDGFDVLESERALPTGSYTVGVVFRLLPQSAGGSVLSGTTYDLRLDSNGIEIDQGGGTVTTPGNLLTGKPYVLLVTYDLVTSTATVHLDGQVLGSGLLSANPDSQFLLGGLDSSFQGAVSEVMVFGSALNANSLATVNRYLSNRYLNGPQLPLVEFDSLPQNGELFPRELPLNSATIDFTGTVREPGFTHIVGSIFMGGLLFDVETDPLVYNGNDAPFQFDLKLDADLVEYELVVTLLSGGSTATPVVLRDRLVAGDVVAIAGQSNALAPDFYAEGLANTQQSPWVRSFGTASEIPEESMGDRTWDQAGALDFDGHGFVGQWGLRMGKELVSSTNVPVAIVNLAKGGTSIAQHQRSMSQATDPNTIYGRGLGRLRGARLDDDVRAMFWYQGESDTGQTPAWAVDFDQLRLDWLLDYPVLEKLYVFQIREGCGALNGGIREFQRNLKNQYSGLELMSTSALPDHRGCHFGFAGYDQLGIDISRQVLRDLYQTGTSQNVDPPQLVSATWQGAGNQVVRLAFENQTDTLVWQAGTEQFVFFDDLAVRVIGVQVNGSTIDLTLDQAAPHVSEIFYIGHAYDGPALVNANGVGALTFFSVPIL